MLLKKGSGAGEGISVVRLMHKTVYFLLRFTMCNSILRSAEKSRVKRSFKFCLTLFDQRDTFYAILTIFHKTSIYGTHFGK